MKKRAKISKPLLVKKKGKIVIELQVHVFSREAYEKCYRSESEYFIALYRLKLQPATEIVEFYIVSDERKGLMRPIVEFKDVIEN